MAFCQRRQGGRRRSLAAYGVGGHFAACGIAGGVLAARQRAAFWRWAFLQRRLARQNLLARLVLGGRRNGAAIAGGDPLGPKIHKKRPFPAAHKHKKQAVRRSKKAFFKPFQA